MPNDSKGTKDTVNEEQLPIDTVKLRALEAEAKEEQKILSLNAWHLARYIIEHSKSDGDKTEGEKIRVEPSKLDLGHFMVMAEKYPHLKENEKLDFINQYADLEKMAGNVTARTLYATRIHGKSFFRSVYNTSAVQHLLLLAMVTALFMILLLMQGISGQILPAECNKEIWFHFLTNSQMIPFYAAGLGACVYLLRITQEKFTSREFDPAWIPSHYIRLGLGTIAGGTIVFFPDIINLLGNHPGDVSEAIKTIHSAALEAAQGADQKTVFEAAKKAALEAAQKIDLDGQQIGLGTGFIAFIFGYAVDIYYAVLDRISGKIKG